MKGIILQPIVCILLALLTGAWSHLPPVQKRPDFSGTWIEDEAQRKSPYAAPAAGGAKAVAGPPPDVIITQTAGQITIDIKFMSGNRYIYDLDGKQSVNRNGAMTATTKSRWEGARLITEGTKFQVTSQGEASWTFKEVRWLTPREEMAVDTTMTDEDGDAKTVHQVFKRKR